MRYDGTSAVRPLSVGEQVKLADGRGCWTVQAVTANFAALTRPVTDADRAEAQAEVDEYEEDSPYREFAERHRDELDEHAVLYTVVDWRNGVRGPCNLIGQGWGDGSYSQDECAAMLADFESGDLEISQRNWVWIEFADPA